MRFRSKQIAVFCLKHWQKKIKRRFGEVVQLTFDGKFVAAFPNAWKAALLNGKRGANSKISDVCEL